VLVGLACFDEDSAVSVNFSGWVGEAAGDLADLIQMSARLMAETAMSIPRSQYDWL